MNDEDETGADSETFAELNEKEDSSLEVAYPTLGARASAPTPGPRMDLNPDQKDSEAAERPRRKGPRLAIKDPTPTFGRQVNGPAEEIARPLRKQCHSSPNPRTHSRF